METNKFITLTCGNSKIYIRADKITQIYEAECGIYVYLDGSDTPNLVKESVDEIFAKINGIY